MEPQVEQKELSKLFFLTEAIVADPARLSDFLTISEDAFASTGPALQAAFASLRDAIENAQQVQGGDPNQALLAVVADQLREAPDPSARLAAHALAAALRQSERLARRRA